ADRQVDVEDPAPRPLVGEISADGGPQNRAQDEAEAPDRHREAALVKRENLPEDRLRERNDRPAAEALEDPRRDQRGQVGGGARGRGGGGGGGRRRGRGGGGTASRRSGRPAGARRGRPASRWPG